MCCYAPSYLMCPRQISLHTQPSSLHTHNFFTSHLSLIFLSVKTNVPWNKHCEGCLVWKEDKTPGDLVYTNMCGRAKVTRKSTPKHRSTSIINRLSDSDYFRTTMIVLQT